MTAAGAACPRCGKSWNGSKPEHCPACHETFGGTVAGDRHRIGDHGLPRSTPGARRCLGPDEMRAAGLRQDAKGIWRTNTGWSGPEVRSDTLEAGGT